MSPFQIRARSLNALGFNNYTQYRASELWKDIRTKVFAVKGLECSMCPRPASCVHHTTYDLDTMSGINLDGLHPLCMGCHKRIEMAGKEKRKWKDLLSLFMEYKEAKIRQKMDYLEPQEDEVIITWDMIPQIQTEKSGLTYATADVLGLPIPLVKGWPYLLMGKRCPRWRWELAIERRTMRASAYKALKITEPRFDALPNAIVDEHVFMGDGI